MAGGVFLTNNASNKEKPSSIPKTTLYTVLITFQACIGGLLFGYDTGVVSSAMLFLPDNKGMNHLSLEWQEIIVSVTPGMAGVGALVAGTAADRFGRRMMILFASGVFFIGALLCSAAPERYTLLAGRLFLGLAIGVASMIIPVFISEGSPSHIRGTLVTIYQFMIASGFIVANALGAAFAHIDPYNVGWRLMFAVAAIPAAFQFIGFLFLADTPRYLVNKGREDEAREVLSKVYGGDEEWIDYEMDGIIEAKRLEVEHQASEHGDSPTIVRVFRTPHVRKALILGCSMQMFQQLIGINTLLYYTGTIIQSAGVKDKITTIWISCAISSVQAFGTIAPMKLIEKLGRRPILLTSMFGVMVSLCLMGGAFVMINKDSAELSAANAYSGINWNTVKDNSTLNKCAKMSNCDFCVTSTACGFCHLTSEPRSGQCLPLPTNGSKDSSTDGYCQDAAYSFSNYTMDADFCQTKFTALPIIVMVIYLICFAFGMGPMPWVFNSEVYPLWARGTCVSLSTFTNWMFNLAISLTFLTLGEAIHKYGAFFLYAAIAAVGLVVFYFFIPETKGLDIEEVEELFKSKKERSRSVHKIAPTDLQSDKNTYQTKF